MRFLFGGIFALAGLAMLISGIVTWFTGSDSTEWPTAEGVMVRADVDTRTSSGSRRSSSTSYTPDVEYAYVVDGTEYTGSRYEFIERGEGRREVIEARLAKFPVGGKVAVRYDPDDPANSVLVPGVPSALGIMLFMGVAFVTVGGCVMAFFGKGEKPYRRTYRLGGGRRGRGEGRGRRS